jgi:hypothetical protein
MMRCFPASRHILCVKHLRDNVNAYLENNIGVARKIRNNVNDLLFGETGTACADDSISYEARLESLQEFISVNCPLAADYLLNKVVPLIDDYVREPNMFLNTASLWTNNSCESANHILKLATDWKINQMPDLIDTLHAIVTCQLADLRRALCGIGNFKLCQAAKTPRN